MWKLLSQKLEVRNVVIIISEIRGQNYVYHEVINYLRN